MKFSILNWLNGAQIQTAAYTPTTPYTGTLPSKSVKKGTKGADAKAVQTFLNWCIKAGLQVDSSCGPKTVTAIKKFQKQYGLKQDGHFGPKCKEKAKQIIAKYAPQPTPTKTPQQKACDWARKIAADNTWHYVKWSSNKKTHECPICHNHPKGKYHGWNCIGFSFASWRHGSGIKCNCNCSVINNDDWKRLYKAKTDADALKLARKLIGINDIKVIRSKSNLAQSSLQAGDICCRFDGSTPKHIWLYLGNGQMADCRGSSGKVKNNDQISVRKAQSCKIAIRYTGK